MIDKQNCTILKVYNVMIWYTFNGVFLNSKSFTFWRGSIYQLFLLRIVLLVSNLRTLCQVLGLEINLSSVFSKTFIVLHFTFKFMIHFVLVFVYHVRFRFFCFAYRIFSCSSTICWKNHPYSIELLLHLCKKWAGFISGFRIPFHRSMCLSHSTILCWLLKLYSKP